MLQYTKDLLIIASMAMAAANALTIKSACLTKMQQYGNLTSGTGLAFDQTSQIVSSLDTESLPFTSKTCVTIENQALSLNLFSLSMNTPDGGNQVQMSNVGPLTVKEAFTCADLTLSGTGKVSGVAIYYNASQVTQVQIFVGTDQNELGSKGPSDEFEFIQFDNNGVGSFIGFHGLANADHIESLGIITQDIDCSADPNTPTDPTDPTNPTDPTDPTDPGNNTGGSVNPSRPEPEKLVKDDDDENDDTFFIILAACAGVVFILAVIALVICCCKKGSKRQTSKVEMIRSDPRQESEAAEMKDGTTTVAGMVNASGNGTLPVVETDEEQNANVNVRTNRVQAAAADLDKPGHSGVGLAKKDQSNDVTQ